MASAESLNNLSGKKLNRNLVLFSIVIPARNEAGDLPKTLAGIVKVLDKAAVPFEIIVVNDHSRDNTLEVLDKFIKQDPRVKLVNNRFAPGYGYAVRCGLEVFKGEVVAILMADASDDPQDIIKYYEKIIQGYECVFGTRFSKQSKIVNYPWPKLVLNRLGNFFIQVFFRLAYNDVTNAFKCYSREAVEGISPLMASRFNLTVEMPLKAILRGYKWCVVPVNWLGRKKGISKWKIEEMGSKYLITILSLWRERLCAGRHRSFGSSQ